MSVYDNLLGVCQLSIKDQDKQISTVEKLLDEFIYNIYVIYSQVLSGGEVRRLMMAKILINKPKLFYSMNP